MSRLDRENHRLELKLVLWGPQHSGKTTLLRSLHGACDPARRGEFASVEGDTGEGRSKSWFDFVPLDLPRFRDHDVRVDCFAVPGDPSVGTTRERLLRNCDAILFVADATPRNAEHNRESLLELLGHLEAEGEAARTCPIVVAANKRDAEGSLSAAVILARITEGIGPHTILGAVDTVAASGVGVIKAFRRIVLAAAEEALEEREPLGRTTGIRLLQGLAPAAKDGPARTWSRLFISALDAQFGSSADGVPLEQCAQRRTVSASPAPRETASTPQLDTGEIDAAVEATRWLALRDGDVQELQKERAYSRLLSEVGQLCSTAGDLESLVRGVLIRLVMNLDAITGWVGLPSAFEGEQVFDSVGRARDAAVVAEVAQSLRIGLPPGGMAPVGRAATAGFPGGASDGQGLFLPIPVPGSDTGWLMLIGPPKTGLGSAVEPALRTVSFVLGLAISRLRALNQFSQLNRSLEERVEERTYELRQEMEQLRTEKRSHLRELESAKRAALETEQVLIDRERSEVVQHLAAGVAHELNNPISAIQANLQEALDLLHDEEPDLVDLKEICEDSLEAAKSVAGRVTKLFGTEVAEARRAAHRTPLGKALIDAVSHFTQVCRPETAPVLAGRHDVFVGVAPGELTRWVFRLLCAVAPQRMAQVRVASFSGPEGPSLRIDVDQPMPPEAHEIIQGLRHEVLRARGSLAGFMRAGKTRLDLRLPPATGHGRRSA